jgi:multidrug resistance efflux pump
VLHFIGGRKAAATDIPEDEEAAAAVQVKAVHPHGDPNFEMRVFRPANVEAYYRAPIEARVAGEAKWIRVARGSRVKKGDLLVQVSVPDLDADAKMKEAVVRQRRQERDQAEKAVDTAKANVEEKKTLLAVTRATTEYRRVDYNRVARLRTTNSIDQDAVDVAKENLAIAQAQEAAADAARVKAEAELVDARELVKVKASLIPVAEAARDAAKALAEYGLVKAPWDGTVVNRHISPGSFVQNASTGYPTPLVTLERTDIVTVVMRVPDNVAPFVKAGMEATLELDALPGVKIQGRVTRLAPSLETTDRDRTMRVEVDLWNGPPSQFPAFLAANFDGDRPKPGADVKDGLPPLVPIFTNEDDELQRSRRLMSDMYGRMTLSLRSFGKFRLIPSVAVLHEGGREFLYVVENGKAHRVPIRVQVDDGNLAKVVVLDKNNRVHGELTGKEEVIVSNLEEVSEGQPVAASVQEDWGALKTGR